MHVAYSLLTLLPGQFGGSEVNAKGILGAFRAGAGPEQVTALVNPVADRSYAQFDGGPVSVRRVDAYRPGVSAGARLAAMTRARLAPGRLNRALADLRPDVIHYPLTVPLPVMRGVPSVVALHDLQHEVLPEFFSAAERIYRRFAYRGAAQHADFVVTLSEYSRAAIVESYGIDPDRIGVSYLGIDHDSFDPEPNPEDAERLAATESPGDQPFPENFIFYPANLWPHKNHQRLIAAFAQASPSDGQLILTGATYDRLGELHEAARKHGVADRIRHLGYLPPETLPAIYRAARGLIFPSLFEGFGVPPLEAMACGCPVAVSRVTSLPEVCGPHAQYIETPDDVESIAAAVSSLFGHAGKSDPAAVAHARTFTWERAANCHKEFYSAAANSGEAVPPSRG